MIRKTRIYRPKRGKPLRLPCSLLFPLRCMRQANPVELRPPRVSHKAKPTTPNQSLLLFCLQDIGNRRAGKKRPNEKQTKRASHQSPSNAKKGAFFTSYFLLFGVAFIPLHFIEVHINLINLLLRLMRGTMLEYALFLPSLIRRPHSL